jgi:hypothetical protein
MDAVRFDRLAKLLSRRGLAALLGGGLLAGHAPQAAHADASCGGTPTELTRFCRTAGSCETDLDCADGCACQERRIGCCRKVRRGRGRRRGVTRCIDGRPGLYCTPVT